VAGRKSTTEFRILGPFEVHENGQPLEVGKGKQQALLALLLLNLGEVVSTDRLIDALWGERPPESALNSLHVYVSHLRKALGAERLRTRERGYLLSVDPEQLDLVRFERLAAEGREALAAGDAERAEKLLRTALALWRGPPLQDFASEPFAQTEIARLEELRLIALEERIEADLALGRHAELVPELVALVRANPLRERLPAYLMLALYRSGRQGEALEAYRQARAILVEELGIEPSRRLQELERAILSQDPQLDPPTRTAVLLRRARRRSGLLIAVGAAALLAAAFAVVLIELSSGGSPGLSSAAENAAGLIDAETNRLEAVVPVRNGPTGIAVGEGAVWVSNAEDNSVSRIDLASRTVVDDIPVGGSPSGIAVGAGAVWVANSVDGTVSRIDPQTNTVVQWIRVGVTPLAVAVGARERVIWVTNADSRSVTKIDAASGRVIRRMPTGAIGRGIAVGAGSVWVTDESSRSVVRIDPQRGRILQTIGVGNGPAGVAFGAGSVWVANTLDGTVLRIDPSTNKVTATIPVGEGPRGIGVGQRAVWVSVEFPRSVVRIDPAEDRVVERIPIGNRPAGLAVSRNEVWFAVQPSGAGHRGGRLVVAGSFVGSIDPDPAFGGPSFAYDGLLGPARRVGSGSTQIVPNLADSLPVITGGGTRYAFRLRRGIRYSDGTLVKASDFRRAFERLFQVGSPMADGYPSLLGADVCGRRPRRCDLSRGVRTDDATGTIVFHLRRPDGEFLGNLVGSPAPVPPGTVGYHVGTPPVPSTGPYMITSFVRRRVLRFVRNPYFHVWSQTARPDGFSDEIEFKLDLSAQSAVTAVERGRVDVAPVPVDRLEEVKTRYASQLHVTPAVATWFLFLNTTLPPFDDVRVRRALNFAVDRAAVTRVQGGLEFARPTCQIRPPLVAGYRPYCPYTIDPSPTGEWKAPDIARARQLVAASGTAGMKVTVWTWPNRAPAAREVVSALTRLGYRARLKVLDPDDYWQKLSDERTRVQAGMHGWISGSGAPASSFLPTLTCGSIRPGLRNANPSFFCNRRIDARIRRALRIQATDPDAVTGLWVRIERELVDQAPWVPLYTPRWPNFVSKRVGNYQYGPGGDTLLDQLWVR
jgi:YVTN family beta-propeller protein